MQVISESLLSTNAPIVIASAHQVPELAPLLGERYRLIGTYPLRPGVHSFFMRQMKRVSELGSSLLKRTSIRNALRKALPLVLLAAFFGLLFYQLLSTHMLAKKADGLYSGGSTWGDLAWHLSMISNFQRGASAVKENPIFPGTRLSYPFVPDLVSAWLVHRGLGLRASLIAPSLLTLLGLTLAVYFLARTVGASAIGSVASVILVLFNGSIVGMFYLWSDYRSAVNRRWTLTLLSNDYSHLPDRNLRFSNFVCELLLPQRAADFGFFIGTIAITLFWLYWKDFSRKSLFYGGLVLSCLPLIHFHTFVALGIVAGSLFVIEVLFVEPRQWRDTARAWTLFSLPIMMLALPQVLWILPGHAGHFLRPTLGWMTGSDSVWWFWFKNMSPHMFIFALAPGFAKPKVKTFYLAFVGLFAVSNLVIFQPHDYDNLKLMFWWFLMSCILTGLMLDCLVRRFRLPGLSLSLVVFISMIATGSMAVWRELHLSSRMFSTEDIALAQFVKDHTSTDVIFLTSDRHNNPISCLAGRRIVMGYRGWLWTHGLNYSTREHDVIEMFRGSNDSIDLLKQYQVAYVLLEQDKFEEFRENPEFFKARFPVVYSSAKFTLLQISPTLRHASRQIPNCCVR
jgi:hypothetical protein